MYKYKITYFADGDRTIVKEDVLETVETLEQVKAHAHILTVEPLSKVEPKKEIEEKVKPQVKKDKK